MRAHAVLVSMIRGCLLCQLGDGQAVVTVPVISCQHCQPCPILPTRPLSHSGEPQALGHKQTSNKWIHQVPPPGGMAQYGSEPVEPPKP